MAKPDYAKSGCFSGFLQVLLCDESGNIPPVQPSYHITESDETKVVHPNKDHAMADAATPGVVARLMGLDSLPNNTNLVSKGTVPDSVPRSSSLNFVDYMLKIDTSQANHRPKTSASFREVPALIHQKNHDNVVLYWDSVSEKDGEVGSNMREQEMGLGESRQKKKQGSKNKEIKREKITMKERNHGKNKKISKLKNEPRMVPMKNSSKVPNHNAKVLPSVSACSKNCMYRKSGTGSSSCSKLQNKQKKVFSEPKITKDIRKQQSPVKIETEYSSEKHSPVSVLDLNDYAYLYGPDFLDYTSPIMSKSKWESSELQFLGEGVEDRASKNKGFASPGPDINREKEYFSELMLKLLTLTENDMRELDCTQKRMCETESFEELCLVYEHKIFDILLHEVVNELVELSC